MAPVPKPPIFTAAFETCLKNQTGIVISQVDFRPDELCRDLDRVQRLGGFAGDEAQGNEALKAKTAGGQEKYMSEDFKGPEGLLAMVEKLGPVNLNLTSAAFLKPFFKHLNLSQLNIVSFDTGMASFKNLTNLDVSRNNISAVDFLPPNLKFLKIYNNKVTEITCVKQPPVPSLCFLGIGHNALPDSTMPQLVQRFRGLLSLDVSYNNLTSLARFLENVSSLRKLKHLCAVGNPLCLLPYYRLVVVKQLPTLQLLDEQPVTEAETADAQLVNHGHLEVPPYLNVAISFSEVTYLKRLLVPLALELPATKMTEDELDPKSGQIITPAAEVPVSEEDRVAEVAQKGTFFLRIDLPGEFNGAFPGGFIDTTEIAIEEPPPEEPVPVKGGKPGQVVEPPPKPPGEPIDLTGLKRALPVLPDAPAPAPAAVADAETAEGETAPAPTDAPLFFPLPLADCPSGVDGLLQVRDWLRLGVSIKALYRKKLEPVDPDAAPPAGEDPDAEARAVTPVTNEPRLIGGGVLCLSGALCPQVSPASDEPSDTGMLPALPPTLSLGPTTLILAPYSKWLEPDVQVPEAPQSKSLSDVSASVTMDVGLYAKEQEPEEDPEAA